VKEAAPDGRTILVSPDSMLTIYQSVYKRLGYDPATDVTAVSSICSFNFAFAIGPGVPDSVKTLTDFIAWGRANPEKAQYASPAAGSMPHFLGDLFFRAAGLPPKHVPYRGSAPALQDLVGGHVASCITVLGEFLPFRSANGVRMLGTTGTQRSRFMTDVPTFTEQGFDKVVGTETYGVFLPRQAPAPLVQRLNALVREAAGEGMTVEGLARAGMDALAVTPESYAARLANERTAWAPIVRASGFSIED
jgi:tripartite-type tricarboxylate transporter receptor subunit TctC